MVKGFRYLRFHSLTWWAGIMAIALGVAAALGVNSSALGVFSTVISSMLGGSDASPASLIVLGLGIIGIRDKMERGA